MCRKAIPVLSPGSRSVDITPPTGQTATSLLSLGGVALRVKPLALCLGQARYNANSFYHQVSTLCVRTLYRDGALLPLLPLPPAGHVDRVAVAPVLGRMGLLTPTAPAVVGR